jgi:hypothetical protein
VRVKSSLVRYIILRNIPELGKTRSKRYFFRKLLINHWLAVVEELDLLGEGLGQLCLNRLTSSSRNTFRLVVPSQQVAYSKRHRFKQ